MTREAMEAMGVKALEQEPCEDAISRQAVLKIIDGWYENNRDIENIEDLIILITYMAPVNPQPKTGHWINTETKGVRYAFWCRYKCSLCGGLSEYANFCPNCGAKMIEPQESEGTDADSN